MRKFIDKLAARLIARIARAVVQQQAAAVTQQTADRQQSKLFLVAMLNGWDAQTAETLHHRGIPPDRAEKAFWQAESRPPQ